MSGRSNLLSGPFSTQITQLLALGVPLERARKALTSTGYRGVDLASQWLSLHSNDPELDNDNNREYVLYLCPTGELEQQISNYFEATKKECGWHAVHNYPPHISLTSTFSVPDCNAANVIYTFKKKTSKDSQFFELLHDLPLQLYVSKNYIGLYVKENVSTIHNFVKGLVYELKRQGAIFKEGEKKFHLPLAYHFTGDKYPRFSELLHIINPDSPCTWELKMFSRDSHYAGYMVYKVLQSYSPCENHELALNVGDYIFVNSDNEECDKHKWCEGTSFLSGISGLINTSFVERTGTSCTWTSFLSPMSNVTFTAGSRPVDCKENNLLHATSSRSIYVMRHGERVDFTFGNWIPSSFDQKGNYVRKDINLPKTLPKRIGGPQDYLTDCPLTTIGESQSFITGDAMKDCGIKIDYAFVSPSFRCIQTAHNVLLGLGLNDSIPLCIEPGLFEWNAWYSEHFPSWFTPCELSDHKFFINSDYSPVIEYRHLSEKPESLEQYYKRSFTVMKSVIDMTGEGNILIVAHAASLDTCSRELTGKPPRKLNEELTRILPNISYCSVVHLQNIGAGWKIVEPPFPPLTHATNQRFDYRLLFN